MAGWFPDNLRCGCIEGALTNEEHHESWCPAVTGDYSGLPVIDPLSLTLVSDDPALD